MEEPPGGELREDLSFLLARANALSLASGNAALATYGLKVRSYSVLALATSSGRTSQRDIADFLRLDPSQVVALVDDLQTRGLVTREPDPADRRTNVVIATLPGRELYAAAEGAIRAAEREAHAGLRPDDRATLVRLLGALAFPAPG